MIQIEQQQPHMVLYEFYKRVYPWRKKQTLDIQIKINEPILAQREHLMESKLKSIYNKSLASPDEKDYWEASLQDIEKLYEGKICFGKIGDYAHMFCFISYIKSQDFAQLFFHLIREFQAHRKSLKLARGSIHIQIGIFHHTHELCVDGKHRNIFLYAMEDIDKSLSKKKNRISSKLERRQIVLRWIAFEKSKNPKQKFKRWWFYVKQIGDHEKFSQLEFRE